MIMVREEFYIYQLHDKVISTKTQKGLILVHSIYITGILWTYLLRITFTTEEMAISRKRYEIRYKTEKT